MKPVLLVPREVVMPPSTGGSAAPIRGDVKFSDMLKSTLGEVNQLQQQAGQSIQRLATGEIHDVHQVMVAAEEASIAFELMMEIRNKLMDAYQEVMRTQV
jgi:flagellar hook-basal body complex protein FliE